MDAYANAVSDVIDIHLTRANAHPGHTPEKINHVTALFAYLLRAEVKPLLLQPNFAELRHVLLDRIHAFSYDVYARAYADFHLAMAALLTHLVQDDTPPLSQSAIEALTAPCQCDCCATTADALVLAQTAAADCLQSL